MNKQRYRVQHGWRNIMEKGRIPAKWYRVVKTDIHAGGVASNQDGPTVFESDDLSDCIDECNRLNEQRAYD